MNVRNRIGYAVCIIIGLVFIVLGLFMLNKNLDLKNNGVKTTAQVVSIKEEYDGEDTIYYITLEYLANGKEYQTVVQDFACSLKTGEQVEVYYLASDPTNLLVERLDNVFPIAITCVGGVVLLLGIILIASYYRKRKLHYFLREQGVRLDCKITYFTHQENYNLSKNKRKAIRVVRLLDDYMVKLKCVDSCGRTYKESFYMQINDVYKVGDTIDVYLHPTNPKKYFIDRKSYLERLDLKGEGANQE